MFLSQVCGSPLVGNYWLIGIILIYVTWYLQDINQINTHADEMDLFTMVSRRFKKVFSKQEQMRTFPIYDASIEVCPLFVMFKLIICGIFGQALSKGFESCLECHICY